MQGKHSAKRNYRQRRSQCFSWSGRSVWKNNELIRILHSQTVRCWWNSRDKWETGTPGQILFTFRKQPCFFGRYTFGSWWSAYRWQDSLSAHFIWYGRPSGSCSNWLQTWKAFYRQKWLQTIFCCSRWIIAFMRPYIQPIYFHWWQCGKPEEVWTSGQKYALSFKLQPCQSDKQGMVGRIYEYCTFKRTDFHTCTFQCIGMEWRPWTAEAYQEWCRFGLGYDGMQAAP